MGTQQAERAPTSKREYGCGGGLAMLHPASDGPIYRLPLMIIAWAHTLHTYSQLRVQNTLAVSYIDEWLRGDKKKVNREMVTLPGGRAMRCDPRSLGHKPSPSSIHSVLAATLAVSYVRVPARHESARQLVSSTGAVGAVVVLDPTARHICWNPLPRVLFSTIPRSVYCREMRIHKMIV